MMPKEECPYEALAHVFNKYFIDTNRINTNEDYLNFGWAAPLLTESDWSIMKHHTKKMQHGGIFNRVSPPTTPVVVSGSLTG